jgi:HAD superfamily hydrolase (TIGR01484 family)
MTPNTLATDLDGTFIPLHGNSPNEADLSTFHKMRETVDFNLVFATGRHFASVIDAIKKYRLPLPDWIICDVGSSIYEKNDHHFEFNPAYNSSLKSIVGNHNRSEIEAVLERIKSIKLQVPSHQTEFKISYECAQTDLESAESEIQAILDKHNAPYDCLASLDPFTERGLLDVLPRGINKAFAIKWLSRHLSLDTESIIYAGDSGNDYAAMIEGFLTVIVSNAVKGLSERVTSALMEKNLGDRYYIAKAEATSGVLEGCKHWGIFQRSN